MTKILYIGNNLNNPKTNLSTIQTLGSLLEGEGYSLKYSSSLRLQVFRLIEMLWACIKQRHWADVVIIDTYSTLNFYYALIVSQGCRFLKKPYICSLNGGKLPQRIANSPRQSKLIFENSITNVAPSKYLDQAFKNAGYQTTYIPNTIQIDQYAMVHRTYDTMRLLWVRSFASIYNPVMAIEVQHELIKKGYEVTLAMVGPDSDGSQKEVEDLAQNLKTPTSFTGKLSKADWIAYSKDFNIFINTTNFDNTPVSVIEAMALGLPVVSTNVGGMPFLIQHEEEGLLVGKEDVSAMANAIIKIYSDEVLRARCIQNARHRVEQYDWSKVKILWKNLLH